MVMVVISCLYTPPVCIFFFFNDTATTEIYTLSLHDALPIYVSPIREGGRTERFPVSPVSDQMRHLCDLACLDRDRKSTRLNSSHSQISYAVFCLKKKKKHLPILSILMI